MDPSSEWTVVELRAELKRLNLSVSGNKQELYERLLEASEIVEDLEDDSDWEYEPEEGSSDIDFAVMGQNVLRTVRRYKVPITAILIVVVLVGAVAFAGMKVLDVFKQDEVAEVEPIMWQFTIQENELTEVQTIFVEDDATETISLMIPISRNLSSVYFGAYWGESDEQPGGIVGCDEVTVEVVLTDVDKTALYSLSSTEASSQDCDADGTEPWDHIWYQYDLDLPSITSFEGTEEEALAIWDTFTGIGTGEWFIEISVDTYAVWGTVCDCEDGEEVQLTVSYTEYEVEISKPIP